MSIRFAPAAGSQHDMTAFVLASRGVRRMRLRANNDNPPAGGRAATFDPLLIEALQHFSRHGLAAVPRARHAAAEALADGSAAGFDRWVAITAMFDPRLARQTALAARPAQD